MLAIASEILASATVIVLSSLWLCDRVDRRRAIQERRDESLDDPDGLFPYHGADAPCSLCGRSSHIHGNLKPRGEQGRLFEPDVQRVRQRRRRVASLASSLPLHLVWLPRPC